MSAVLRPIDDERDVDGPVGETETVEPLQDAPDRAASSNPDVPSLREASVHSTMGNEPVPGALAVQLAQMVDIASPSDWNNTLSLVERAAATIRSYEKRYLHLERQSRSIADRAAEDHHRMSVQVQALEERVKRAEARATAAEAAAREAEYEEWEAESRAKRLEQRATEAEARALQAEAYLRRVHDLLSAV